MSDGFSRDGFGLRVSEAASGRVTVSLRGDLDYATAPQLTAALESLPDGGDLEVYVDLHAVAFIDSGGLRALLDARHLFPDRLFIRADGRARDLLEVTGCDKFLTIR